MRHLDLFSGIGGFALAARWMAWETVAFCDNEPYTRRVISRYWPGVPIIEDIRHITEPIGCDIITGGFPCQPFSHAGKQRGSKDDRYLWPEMLRVIALERPTWVVGENVTGIISLALDQVLLDLENQGYTARPFVIPAVGVDAGHQRARVWIIGYSNSQRQPAGTVNAIETSGVRLMGDSDQQRLDRSRKSPEQARWGQSTDTGQSLADTKQPGLERHSRNGNNRNQPGWLDTKPDGSTSSRRLSDRHQWPTEPGVGRVVNGIPNRVDRIRALGNAIVPQVAYRIFQAIQSSNSKIKNLHT
jgi:DNA (cytosine-5)-methyltransferase 1